MIYQSSTLQVTWWQMASCCIVFTNGSVFHVIPCNPQSSVDRRSYKVSERDIWSQLSFFTHSLHMLGNFRSKSIYRSNFDILDQMNSLLWGCPVYCSMFTSIYRPLLARLRKYLFNWQPNQMSFKISNIPWRAKPSLLEYYCFRLFATNPINKGKWFKWDPGFNWILCRPSDILSFFLFLTISTNFTDIFLLLF